MNIPLKEIREELLRNLNLFTWTVEQVTIGQTTMLRINGLVRIRSFLDNISRLGLFEDLVNDLRNSAIYTTSSDQINIQTSEGRTVERNLNSLTSLAKNFLDVLLKTVPPEDANSINIKLPPVSDFDELSKVSR